MPEKRLKQWIEEENIIPRIQEKHEQELQKLKQLHKLEISRLKTKKITKRRCSNCLAFYHTKRTCKNSTLPKLYKKLFKQERYRRYR